MPIQKQRREKTLTKTKNWSHQVGQPSERPETLSNDKFDSNGHKSTDRKTGLAKTDNHFSWRQVAHHCGIDPDGHEL